MPRVTRLNRHHVVGAVVAILVAATGAAWSTGLFSGEASYPMTVVVPIDGVSVDPMEPEKLAVSVTTKGYCAGAERKPELGGVEVRRTAGERVVLTAHVVYFQPAPTEPCDGVGLGLVARMNLRPPVAADHLYDGSSSPPTRLHTLPWHDLVPSLSPARRAASDRETNTPMARVVTSSNRSRHL